MNIYIYVVAHNEEFMLPYFMRHYKQFSNNITLWDNESTDSTVEIAKDMGANVVRFDTGGAFYEAKNVEMKNSYYKRDRGKSDWAIVVDVDELIWHPDLAGILKIYKKEKITVPLVDGYEMISDIPPKLNGQIYDEIKTGMPSRWYCKRAVFDPVVDINFGIGSHFCKPTGTVRNSSKADIKLLHYRLLGIEYLISRWKVRLSRQSDENKKNGWNPIVSTDPEKVRNWIKEYTSKCIPRQVIP